MTDRDLLRVAVDIFQINRHKKKKDEIFYIKYLLDNFIYICENDTENKPQNKKRKKTKRRRRSNTSILWRKVFFWGEDVRTTNRSANRRFQQITYFLQNEP